MINEFPTIPFSFLWEYFETVDCVSLASCQKRGNTEQVTEGKGEKHDILFRSAIQYTQKGNQFRVVGLSFFMCNGKGYVVHAAPMAISTTLHLS